MTEDIECVDGMGTMLILPDEVAESEAKKAEALERKRMSAKKSAQEKAIREKIAKNLSGIDLENLTEREAKILGRLVWAIRESVIKPKEG